MSGQSAKDAPVVVSGQIKQRRPMSVEFVDGSGHSAFLPRSQILKLEEGMFDTARVTMPTWLAREKGFSADVDERQGELL